MDEVSKSGKWPRKFTMTTTYKERLLLEQLREFYGTRDVRIAILRAAKEILKNKKRV